MSTILDVQSAAHAVWMEAEEMVQQFVDEVMRPFDELQEKRDAQKVVMFWDQLPPEAHAMMEKEDPEGHAKAMKMIAEMRKKVKNG